MNVAVAARIGLPIVADGRAVGLIARRRTRFVVARFRDAAGARAASAPRSTGGDRTRWNGVVLGVERGVYDVRSSKRYARAGRYSITVTLTDSSGRSSIARGRALVSRPRR
jgi:hypothetical protein